MKLTRLLVSAVFLILVTAPGRASAPDIYPDPAQAPRDVAAALKNAAATHRRVLLDFGGNWCGDCHALDIYFHDLANKPILNANFILVHINIGHMDENQALARKYQVPLDRGVPALAVLGENGALLYSQRSGEFNSMSAMQSSAVTQFLVRWRPARKGCSVMVINC